MKTLLLNSALGVALIGGLTSTSQAAETKTAFLGFPNIFAPQQQSCPGGVCPTPVRYAPQNCPGGVCPPQMQQPVYYNPVQPQNQTCIPGVGCFPAGYRPVQTAPVYQQPFRPVYQTQQYPVYQQPAPVYQVPAQPRPTQYGWPTVSNTRPVNTIPASAQGTNSPFFQ